MKLCFLWDDADIPQALVLMPKTHFIAFLDSIPVDGTKTILSTFDYLVSKCRQDASATFYKGVLEHVCSRIIAYNVDRDGLHHSNASKGTRSVPHYVHLYRNDVMLKVFKTCLEIGDMRLVEGAAAGFQDGAPTEALLDVRRALDTIPFENVESLWVRVLREALRY